MSREVRIGPYQKDGSILTAAYDLSLSRSGEEVHDVLIGPEGEIVSENIWGGERFYGDSKHRGEHHCLILVHEGKRIYHHNEKMSHFHWEDVELEVWSD